MHQKHLKLRILVVEDHDLGQKIITMTLQRMGYLSIDTAGTGSEALKKFAEQQSNQRPYDLILMDLGLPDIDGYTVSEMIRDLEDPGQHTMIIAVTASVSQTCKQEALDADMDGFISKPCTIEKLQAMLAEYA
jgi:CheY-like chemotaxis protein